MIMSSTSDFVMPPNAAPMITPTARSSTLPRIRNVLKSEKNPIATPPSGPKRSPPRDSEVPADADEVGHVLPLLGAGRRGVPVPLDPLLREERLGEALLEAGLHVDE